MVGNIILVHGGILVLCLLRIVSIRVAQRRHVDRTNTRSHVGTNTMSLQLRCINILNIYLRFDHGNRISHPVFLLVSIHKNGFLVRGGRLAEDLVASFLLLHYHLVWLLDHTLFLLGVSLRIALYLLLVKIVAIAHYIPLMRHWILRRESWWVLSRWIGIRAWLHFDVVWHLGSILSLHLLASCIGCLLRVLLDALSCQVVFWMLSCLVATGMCPWNWVQKCLVVRWCNQLLFATNGALNLAILLEFFRGHLSCEVCNGWCNLLWLLGIIVLHIRLLLYNTVLIVGCIILALHPNPVDLSRWTVALHGLNGLSSLHQWALHCLVRV